MEEKNLSNLQVNNYDFTKFMKKNSIELSIENYNNNDLYSSFLTDFYSKKADFKLLSNKNLNRFENKFWLEDSLEAFNGLIGHIKNEEIKPNEATQFLPTDKILWGFTIEMKEYTKTEELENQTNNAIAKFKLQEKQKELDELIEKKLNAFIKAEINVNEIKEKIQEYIIENKQNNAEKTVNENESTNLNEENLNTSNTNDDEIIYINEPVSPILNSPEEDDEDINSLELTKH